MSQLILSFRFLSEQGGNFNVARIEFSDSVVVGHRHPSSRNPILLTVKAAVTWSRRYGVVLVAQAEPKVDDEHWDEEY